MSVTQLPHTLKKYAMQHVDTGEYWEGLLMESTQADDLHAYGILDPEIWKKKELIYNLEFVEV